jgi:hypothetical protein
MRWRKKRGPANLMLHHKWKLPLFKPLTLDDGTRVMWEWVQYRPQKNNQVGEFLHYRDRAGIHIGTTGTNRAVA